MGELLAGRASVQTVLEESSDDVSALRIQMNEQRRELSTLRDVVDRLAREKSAALQEVSQTRSELQAAMAEAASVKTECTLLASQLASALTVQHEHTAQLKDVAVLRAQQGFVQAAADRADLAAAEHGRLLGEVRAELAGLQQRHAALASGAAAEHAAHRQTQAALRSTAEGVALQLESLTGDVGSLRASETAAGEECEKLKKAAKRHEMLLHRVSEVHEARAGELRALIKALSDQIKPLHETSRRHAAQIEEVSSGINGARRHRARRRDACSPTTARPPLRAHGGLRRLAAVTSPPLLPRHATPHHATPRHTTPRHATPRPPSPRRVIPLHTCATDGCHGLLAGTWVDHWAARVLASHRTPQCSRSCSASPIVTAHRPSPRR